MSEPTPTGEPDDNVDTTIDDDAVFAAIRRARLRFADLVADLDADALATASLCAGWSVRDVAGHLVLASKPPKARLLAALVRARGSYDRAMDRLSRAEAARPLPELVAALRTNAASRFTVAGVGPRGPLTDVLVHTVDVAFPLGLPWTAHPGAVRAALEFVTTGRAGAFVDASQLKDLRLHAPDVGFASGDGATLRGNGIDLLTTVCGRAALLDRLGGPGVAILRSRAPWATRMGSG